mmetsp:Transcript_49253/g.118128  ORF Transcript_49253/g.118128 Transcript_49253/m.118128 type:complete len:344 (-) Transcript_49253:282-1313(-)
MVTPHKPHEQLLGVLCEVSGGRRRHCLVPQYAVPHKVSERVVVAAREDPHVNVRREAGPEDGIDVRWKAGLEGVPHEPLRVHDEPLPLLRRQGREPPVPHPRGRLLLGVEPQHPDLLELAVAQHREVVVVVPPPPLRPLRLPEQRPVGVLADGRPVYVPVQDRLEGHLHHLQAHREAARAAEARELDEDALHQQLVVPRAVALPQEHRVPPGNVLQGTFWSALQEPVPPETEHGGALDAIDSLQHRRGRLVVQLVDGDGGVGEFRQLSCCHLHPSPLRTCYPQPRQQQAPHPRSSRHGPPSQPSSSLFAGCLHHKPPSCPLHAPATACLCCPLSHSMQQPSTR